MSIPKIIHYCWFGNGPLGDLETKCIESWKKFCPDFEIKRWDETNFDISCNNYVEEAYKAKKYAFVSDYARLVALNTFGGIYFDTDVELIKPVETLLNNSGFISLEVGAPTPYGRLILANTGSGVGCEPNNAVIQKMMMQYNKLSIITDSGDFDLTTCAERGTSLLKKLGFDGKNRYQNINGFAILPSDYFSPLDFATGRLKITENTLGIHRYNNSWQNFSKIYKLKMRLKCTKIGMLAMRVKYDDWKKPRYFFRNLNNQIKFFLQKLKNRNLKYSKHIYFYKNLKLRLNKESNIFIGDSVESDGKLTVVTGRKGRLSIGDGVYFNDGCTISCLGKISVGNNTLFGCGVNIFDNNHIFGKNGVSRRCKAGTIQIGKNCWIASNAVILKGAKIGDNSVIGAGCIINCEIPDNSIVRQNNNLKIERIIDNDS